MAVILFLLACLPFFWISTHSGPDRSLRTAALVSVLEAGCKQYRVEWGVYPPGDAGGGTSTLVKSLGMPRGKGGFGDMARAPERPPIVELLPRDLDGGRIVDEWGRPLRYANPGRRNKEGIDLWSAGYNGVDELDPKHPDFDDVTNWVRIE